MGPALVALADKLRGLAIIDGPGTTDEAALAYAENFGAKRAFMVDPGVKYWDTGADATVDAPASAWVAGLFAWTDNEYGFWASPSNKEFVGITGTTRAVEFLDGDETCRANLLNNANITTIIRDDGFRLWGNRTLSSDPKWAFVTRVRTMDIVMDAILYGHKWAVDRSITATYVKDVTEGLEPSCATSRPRARSSTSRSTPTPSSTPPASWSRARCTGTSASPTYRLPKTPISASRSPTSG